MNQKKRVLVIHDGQTSVQSIITIPEYEFSVIMKPDDEEICEVMDENAPELIILETHKSDVRSLEGFEAIRQIDSTIPIIVISDVKPENSAEQLKAMGIYGYFLKPFSANELKKNISEAISSREPLPDPDRLIFPVDLEAFINDAIESEIGKNASLKDALENFQKKYAEFTVEKHIQQAE